MVFTLSCATPGNCEQFMQSETYKVVAECIVLSLQLNAAHPSLLIGVLHCPGINASKCNWFVNKIMSLPQHLLVWSRSLPVLDRFRLTYIGKKNIIVTSQLLCFCFRDVHNFVCILHVCLHDHSVQIRKQSNSISHVEAENAVTLNSSSAHAQ